MASPPTPAPPTPAPAADRKALISKIESLQSCRLVCYATGDRRDQESQIGEDGIPPLYEHLSKIGRTERIALFLYSRGGHTLSGFAIGNAVHEFAKEDVHVLVPFRAHSCATLISLCASQIVMGPFGQLSPIDPSITTPHGPSLQAEGGALKFIPVSVEDVAAFFSLARSEAKLGDEKLSEAFAYLCQRVNPLALGAVFRAREQIGMLARKLLTKHMKEEARTDRIVSALTRELLSHDYVIGRSEAREIGLPVEDSSDELATLMWDLYRDIAAEMKLAQPWNLEAELGGQQQTKRVNVRGVIESLGLKHGFVTTHELKRTTITKDGMKFDAVQSKIVDEGWRQM
jgi:hypothetical protein